MRELDKKHGAHKAYDSMRSSVDDELAISRQLAQWFRDLMKFKQDYMKHMRDCKIRNIKFVLE